MLVGYWDEGIGWLVGDWKKEKEAGWLATGKKKGELNWLVTEKKVLVGWLVGYWEEERGNIYSKPTSITHHGGSDGGMVVENGDGGYGHVRFHTSSHTVW